MSTLVPDLFQRRFDDLMEIGRARLPWLAPDWTDHNAHDPGITLMELLAWVAEAQLYALSRSRRDERAAYAALLGITPHGTKGARGLIWSDRRDPGSPAVTHVRSVVISEDAVIQVKNTPVPTFRPVARLLWVPGRIDRLETRDRAGRSTDLTVANENGSLPFLPFGERAGCGNMLRLRYACRDVGGVFGANRRQSLGALWPIGVLAAGAEGGVPAARSPLSAAVLVGDEWTDVRIVSDSTNGFLSTGVLLLDLDGLAGSPTTFTLELRSPGGFPRPPRVLRIEPNVLPVLQGRPVSQELHMADGMPDQIVSLDVQGLRFSAGDPPVNLQVFEPTGRITWDRCPRLADRGPDESVYECNPASGEIRFGNGINGRIPPAGSQVLATYAVSDGDAGNVARNRSWEVSGFEGTFGTNPDPVAGGAPASSGTEDRREARRRSREDHALVTADDVAAAALELPALEVARAWVAAPGSRGARTGVVRLVALRRRAAGKEPAQPPETAAWLEAIRRRLAPRMLLGAQLTVVAPRYIDFSLRAVAEAEQGLDPSALAERIEEDLGRRLALVDTGDGIASRKPGVPISRIDVSGWVRATAGVRRILQLQLLDAEGERTETISVPRAGLPRWVPEPGAIEVQRPETGRPR